MISLLIPLEPSLRQTLPSTLHKRFCHSSRDSSSRLAFLPVPVTRMDKCEYRSPRATLTEDPGRKASSAYLVMLGFSSGLKICCVFHSALSFVSLYKSCHSLLNSDKFTRRFLCRWYQYFLFSRFTQSAYKDKLHVVFRFFFAYKRNQNSN